jgi:hypothetical protein
MSTVVFLLRSSWRVCTRSYPTMWPVSESVAALFAALFYRELTAAGQGTIDVTAIVRSTRDRLSTMPRADALGTVAGLRRATDGIAARLTLDSFAADIRRRGDPPFHRRVGALGLLRQRPRQSHGRGSEWSTVTISASRQRSRHLDRSSDSYARKPPPTSWSQAGRPRAQERPPVSDVPARTRRVTLSVSCIRL